MGVDFRGEVGINLFIKNSALKRSDLWFFCAFTELGWQAFLDWGNISHQASGETLFSLKLLNPA